MNRKLFALAAAALAVAACKTNEMKPQEGYIGPSRMEIADGRMTPRCSWRWAA